MSNFLKIKPFWIYRAYLNYIKLQIMNKVDLFLNPLGKGIADHFSQFQLFVFDNML